MNRSQLILADHPQLASFLALYLDEKFRFSAYDQLLLEVGKCNSLLNFRSNNASSLL